jgi:hypothetical protein
LAFTKLSLEEPFKFDATHCIRHVVRGDNVIPIEDISRFGDR